MLMRHRWPGWCVHLSCLPQSWAAVVLVVVICGFWAVTTCAGLCGSWRAASSRGAQCSCFHEVAWSACRRSRGCVAGVDVCAGD